MGAALPASLLGWVGGKLGDSLAAPQRIIDEPAGMPRQLLYISWKGKDDVFLSTVAATA
jgi:hypothetical protein